MPAFCEPWRLQHELGHLTPVDRQPLNLALADVDADAGRADIHRADLRLNGHRLGHAGRLKRQIQREFLPGHQLEAVELQRSQLTEGRSDRVNGRPRLATMYRPSALDDDGPFFTRALVLDGDRRPRHDRARRIEHDPSETCIRLGKRHGR